MFLDNVDIFFHLEVIAHQRLLSQIIPSVTHRSVLVLIQIIEL